MVSKTVAFLLALACSGLSVMPASAMSPEPRTAAAQTTAGDLVYRIVDADWHDELTFRDVRYDTGEAFLVVRYSVRNTGSRVSVLREPRLEDADGAVHEASWKGWVLPLSFDRFEALVPGTERDFSVAFEVARRDGHALVFETAGQTVRLPLDPDPLGGSAV